MKKKVLTMLLAVTMSATVGSPVCAADFTSGAESAAEFSESLVSGEGTSENTTDTGTVSEEADVEEKTQRTEEAEEPAAEQEETNDAAVTGELEASEEADAEAFEPLAKAYGMPRETEEEKAEKARVMAIVLKDACAVPMEIMEKCCEAIDVIEEFAAKGSALAISDAGVGVTFCKAALLGASLNVFINTKSMADKEYAASLNEKADKMIADYSKKADDIFAAVNARLR